MKKITSLLKPILIVIILSAVTISLSGCISSFGLVAEELPTLPPTLSQTTNSTSTLTTSSAATSTSLPTLTTTSTSTITLTPTSTLAFTSTNTPSPTITMPSSTSMQCISRDYFETGIVTKITDGDTIHVTIDGVDYPVRLIGIDAPELSASDTYVQQGLSYLQNLILNKNVTLFKDKSDTDKYDRLLRYVVIGNTFVNFELVRLGFATSVTYYPDTACNSTFSSAQADAENNLLGMWVPTVVSRSSGIIINPNPNCSPSYPDVCIPPAPPDLDCKDITYRGFKVLLSDPHKFDGNKDGIGCES